MFARLRFAMAVAFVCACSLTGVLVAAPAAQATATGWVIAHATVNVNNGQDFDCQQAIRMSDLFGTVYLEAAPGGECIGSWDTSIGYCSVGEVGCTEADWAIKGPGCGSDGVGLHPIVSSSPHDTTAHRAISLGASQATATGCDPVEACMTLTYSGFGNDFEATGCAPIALDPPVVVPGSCVHGDAHSAVYVVSDQTYHYNSTTQWYDDEGTASADVGGGGWITYVILDNGNQSGPGSHDSAGNLPFNSITSGVLPNPPVNGNTKLYTGDYRIYGDSDGGAMWPGTEVKNLTGNPPDMTGFFHRVPKGIGVFWADNWTPTPPASGSGGTPPGNTSTPGGWWSGPQSTSYATNFGVVGVNNPARCAFYFGEKLFNNTSTTVDEPAGTITTVPPPDDPPPTIDPPPDPTDEPGWLALIWAVLKSIWGVLGNILDGILGLAGTIASAIASALSGLADLILDGLRALFVPTDGEVDSAFTDVKQEWRDSSPGSFLLGFTETGVSWPSSGCGGIPVDFTMGSVSVDFNIGEACSGAAAAAAATVKLVASASLVLFGGLASVRAIGSGFGWAPGIGRGQP